MVAVQTLNPYRRLQAGAQQPGAPRAGNGGSPTQPRQASAQQPVPMRPRQVAGQPGLQPQAAIGPQYQQPQGGAGGQGMQFVALTPQQQYANWQAQQQGQAMPYQAGFIQRNRQGTPEFAPGAQVPQMQGHQHFASHQDERYYDESGQFNPRPNGGRVDPGEVRRTVQAMTGRMYDKHGQMNAWNNEDALQKLAFLMGNLVNRPQVQARLQKQASPEEKERRAKILKSAMLDPSNEGLSIVGQELLLPIKDIVDYEGWIRKVLRVRPLAQAELFRISRDVRATAWVVGQDGQSIEARVSGKYIQPSHFKVTSFPTVDIADIYEMNYDVLDRVQDTARQEIELEEDKRGVILLDKSSTTVNAVTTYPVLGLAPLEAVWYQVERHRLIVDKFLVNRQEVSDVITTMSTQVDPVTQRELNLAGYWGSFLGAVIMTAAGTGVESVINPGTFYAVTSPEYLGELGVRIELFSEPFNKLGFGETVKGWAFIELIGMIIANSRSVAKGLKV